MLFLQFKKKQSEFVFLRGIVNTNKLIIPFRWETKVYIYNTDTKKSMIKQLGNTCGIVDASYFDNDLFFLLENGEIIKTDLEFANIEKISNHLSEQKKIRYPYRYIIVHNQEIFLFPMYYKTITKVHMKNWTSADLAVEKYFYLNSGYNIYKFADNNKINNVAVLQSLCTTGFLLNLNSCTVENFLNLDAENERLDVFLKQLKNKEHTIQNQKAGAVIWKTLNERIGVLS